MTDTSANNPFIAPQATVDDLQDGTDSTFKLNLFSADGRIGRVRYLGYSMGLGLLIILVGAIISAFISPMLIFVVYLAMFYVNFMLAIKRCHDFNSSGWLSLLVLVPLLALVFLFIPGTDGPNRFGRKTAPNRNMGVIIIVVFVGIFVMGILAAIAIPAYQSYVQRAQAVQGSSQVQPTAQ